MFYGACYYDPLLGRFIQPDPVNDGLNRFAYVANNPLRVVGPTGGWGWDSVKSAAGSAGFWVSENKTQVAIVAAVAVVTVATGGGPVAAMAIGGAISGAQSIAEQRFTGDGQISWRKVGFDTTFGAASGGAGFALGKGASAAGKYLASRGGIRSLRAARQGGSRVFDNARKTMSRPKTSPKKRCGGETISGGEGSQTRW